MFDWLFGTRISVDDVAKLLDSVREFNSGAVDRHLDRHIDASFTKWCEAKGLRKPKGLTCCQK